VSEQGAASIPSHSSPPSATPADYAGGAHAGEYTHDSGSLSLAGMFPDTSFPSMAPPFDFTGVDFSSHIPDFAANALPSDFDEVFQVMAATAPTQTSAVGVLEELGLGGEWQPVMDGLGL
jgi:hypothetical protein